MKPIKNPGNKAVCVAHSWLLSQGVEVAVPQETDNTLSVNGRKVVFVAGDISTFQNTEPGTVIASADEVAAIDLDRTLKEIHRIAFLLNIKVSLQPRTPGAAVKRISTRDYEGVVMRETQFRRTCNPPNHIIQKYCTLVQREAYRAARKPSYARVLKWMGEGPEDLESIGMIYFINHWHQYAEKNSDGLNEKFLVHSLQQQFRRWYSVTWAKLRNVEISGTGVPLESIVSCPVPEATLGVGLVSTSGDSTSDRDFKNLVPSYTPSEYKTESEVLEKPKRSETARRELARAALTSGLAAMPHNQMVETLKTIIASDFIDYYAKKEAKKRLLLHCQDCQNKDCQDYAAQFLK